MKLTKITTEELLQDERREYNPQEWERMVNRMLKYGETEFYIEKKEDSPYNYDNHYAVYTLPEGIRILNKIGYGGSIHNGGFAQAIISSDGQVFKREFTDADGNTGRIENKAANRKQMAQWSQEYKMVFTND